MNKTHVIDFLLNGEVEAMHNDKFSLSFLGEQSIKRATEIVFDDDKQTWALILSPGPLPMFCTVFGLEPVEGGEGFTTYEGARKVEVVWLNSCRVHGVPPDSSKGLELLAIARDSQ